MHCCVSNTSPLIAFSSADCLEILRSVATEVLVPQAVFDEIVTHGSGWTEAAGAQTELARGSWMKCIEVSDSPKLRKLHDRLGGSGEAEVIALAAELGVPVLLDELAGRRAAAALGLKVIGSLGILRLAKSTGVIDRIRPVVTRMVEGGIYFGDELLAQFLKEAGEI
jgi:predicted nucleic acid-binding protein